VQTPLTLDYALIEHDLTNIEIDQRNEKHNRTAIGSAIGLAVRNLRESPAQSRVIVLLTDGINNHGNLDPVTAAEVAKKYGMRVYTIGAGSAQPRSAVARDNPIDEETMTRVSEMTGAKYYRATDLASLQQAYAEISELETTKLDLGEAYDYDEAFMPFLVTGLILMMTALLSRRIWFEAIP
jgi:Ca-activated chloride channel family protein